MKIFLDWAFKYTIKWIRLKIVRNNKTTEYRVKWEILKFNWHSRKHTVKFSLPYLQIKFYKNHWFDCQCGIRRTHTMYNKYEAVRYWKSGMYLGNRNQSPCECCL